MAVPRGKKIVQYLQSVCSERMEIEFNRSRAEAIAGELLVFWPAWKRQVKEQAGQ